jgi:hypothetical protein
VTFSASELNKLKILETYRNNLVVWANATLSKEDRDRDNLRVWDINVVDSLQIIFEFHVGLFYVTVYLFKS